MTAPTVLTVCTGNICRSPAGEILIREHLGAHVVSASAGTNALDGTGIPEPMLAELAADSLDGSRHSGRQLTPALLDEADLVITMTAAHRQHVVQLHPRALRRTFTLAELAAAAGTGAELTGTAVPERLASLPTAIAAHRPVLAGYDFVDVPDPYRRSQADYHEAYTLIRAAVEEFCTWLRG
ncbi:arsenate reductase/protein-tyrosine-phosphatase family protein [Demequina pelophila]|uniref:arsenate reductase/protein-tyrosine-phosphatase family protein n=1 Tax=Demequina pelophila TaxID=1638984 RepID=UPI000784183D|nr:low molecular weight phosphatase family protein [Demequina pelophila]